MTITATYSPEDNKIRLYASKRLDSETYERVKAAGFKWAPKQDLFVAPRWTPQREDLAIELAGEIEPEETTLAERAIAKAERLDNLASKRARDANAFNRAADSLSEAFYMGQPILVGHHSERKARRAKERMDSYADKAVKATNAANYWLYRATGVEHFANMKNNPKVRANRIETLLAELRDIQRRINGAAKRLSLWETADTESLAGMVITRTGLVTTAGYYAFKNGEKTALEIRSNCMESCRKTMVSDNYKRWIEHILNRLSFEREMLGPIPRYVGPMTAVILQAFARTHGADKPKASNPDGDDYWIIESDIPLPAHIGQGQTWCDLTDDEWRDLMQSTGYVVPAVKEGPPPILNLDVETLESPSRAYGKRGDIETWKVERVTKAQYGKVPNDYRGTRPSVCGQYRFKVASARSLGIDNGNNWSYVAVFLTDSKAHQLPESLA